MGWIYDKPRHVHDAPSTVDTAKPIGSVWECNCGEWFRLIECKGSGDQRDWFYYCKWDHLAKGDNVTLNDGRTVAVGGVKAVKPQPQPSRGMDYSGIYAPGTK